MQSPIGSICVILDQVGLTFGHTERCWMRFAEAKHASMKWNCAWKPSCLKWSWHMQKIQTFTDIYQLNQSHFFFFKWACSKPSLLSAQKYSSQSHNMWHSNQSMYTLIRIKGAGAKNINESTKMVVIYFRDPHLSFRYTLWTCFFYLLKIKSA